MALGATSLLCDQQVSLGLRLLLCEVRAGWSQAQNLSSVAQH